MDALQETQAKRSELVYPQLSPEEKEIHAGLAMAMP